MFFVDSRGDLYVGDLHTVIDLYFALTDWADEPLDLHPVLIDYYDLVGDLVGPLPISSEQFADNPEAMKLFKREYRDPWVIKDEV